MMEITDAEKIADYDRAMLELDHVPDVEPLKSLAGRIAHMIGTRFAAQQELRTLAKDRRPSTRPAFGTPDWTRMTRLQNLREYFRDSVYDAVVRKGAPESHPFVQQQRAYHGYVEAMLVEVYPEARRDVLEWPERTAVE